MTTDCQRGEGEAALRTLKAPFPWFGGLPADAPIEESWHWLRHTLATLADEAGMSDAQRQQILRHSTAGMTRRYTHPDWAALADGLNKVGRRVAGERAAVVEFRVAK